jgi:hypothetical protein
MQTADTGASPDDKPAKLESAKQWSFAVLRFSALCGVLALVVGCGGSPTGSGGGSGESPTVVTFTITGGTPTRVAAQVGSGSFTAATLTSGTVTINLPAGTTNFGVAFVCPQISGQTLQVVYEASSLDGNSFTEACPVLPTTPATGTLTGSVDASAIPGASYLWIDTGGYDLTGVGYLPNTVSSSFSIAEPAGADRVEVLAYSGSPNLTQGGYRVVAAKNFSSQTVPGALNGGNTVVLGPADETTSESITYSNVPTGLGTPSTDAIVLTSAGGLAIELANPATTQYPVVPAGATQSGDYYAFTASVGGGNEWVAVTKTSSTAVPVAIAFPPVWSYTGPTPAALPTFNLAYSGFSGATGVSYEVELVWPLAGGNQNLYLFQLTATGNYQGGSTSLPFPDLSGVQGFLAAPASKSSVGWSADLSQGTYPSLQPLPVNGTVASVSNSGAYAVP